MKITEFRIGNLGNCLECDEITTHIGVVTDIQYGKVIAGDWDVTSPVALTKELARDLGFDVLDMGEFWEFNKGTFQLIQMKNPVTRKDLAPFYVVHSKKSKYIKIEFVHKLQNLYFEIENEELIYKNGN